MQLEAIQKEIREQKLDGWLFFDHHQRDPLAYRVLGFEPPRMVTRRWYYFIPAQGEPAGLVHRIERGVLDALPGEKTPYSSWTEQTAGLRALVAGRHRVAMQYSPNCAIPYVAMVDAGTVELVRSLGVEVVTSAELIQAFEARWTPAALESHLEAGRRVDRVRAAAFALIGERTRAGVPIQEVEVKQFILDEFAHSGLFTDHGPIVGVNANASNPHYEPVAGNTSPIRRGDFVLIDMWAKLDQPGSVYYDITWTGFCGDNPSEEMRQVFEIVAGARDAAIERVRAAVAAGQALCGYQVDDVARGYIDARGFGSFFVHRTGHSIGQDVHGNGANMDNLETHDERRVAPWTCFSIEPGIYLRDFGVRSEVNVFVGDREARVTGEMQKELGAGLMAAQTLALAATLLSFTPHGNRVELKLDHGSAEIAWLSPSAFHFRRSQAGGLPKTTWADKEAVEVKLAETPAGLEFRTRHITVSIARRGLLVRVENKGGDHLMEDLSEPAWRGGVLRWERRADPDAQFFGLGRRAAASLNLRGKVVRAEVPFLISTAGYGEYHFGGEYTFDLAASKPDRYAVEARGAPLVDYCFYYGPVPKEIFEEHMAVQAPARIAPADKVAQGSWDTLRDTMLRMIHGSMSGTAVPTFDLRPYLTAPPPLLTRARQFGAIAPSLVFGNIANIEDLRKRLKTFFATYEIEVRDRGFPILHPLPFQFPSDPRAAEYADEFMVGDELLAAPIYTPANKRTLYLPQGLWTDWNTNEEHKGRQVIAVESSELPLFARNGTIVPLDALKRGDALVLHYFPRLGAEFFLLEAAQAEYTQVHAGPAADIVRLEIESVVERDYEWVVHHIAKPAAVGRPSGGRAPDWSYDAKGNLHVRVHVRAGEDCIVNLNFP